MLIGSQKKVVSDDDFLRWARSLGTRVWIAQHKMDGVSAELQYSRGVFQCAVSRGDGVVGDDITAQVSRIPNLRRIIDPKFDGAIRAEIVILKSQHQQRYPEYKNPRNTATGIIHRKDCKGSEYLMLYCFDAFHRSNPAFFSGEIDKLRWLERAGFLTIEWRRFDQPEEIARYRNEVAAIHLRGELDFDIDGLVVKGDDIDRVDMRLARPDRQIAFKFVAKEQPSRVISVEWSGFGAIYTPVAIIEPVSLAGTTVKRASLSNLSVMREMGIMIGSRVAVTKRGEIIPKIERVIENPPDAKHVDIPSHCKECGEELTRDTRLYCPNTRCPRRVLHRLRKWISSLDIREFGDALIGTLFERGLVRSIADLYRLTTGDIASMKRYGEISAKKAIKALQAVDSVSLAKFVAGFDIEGVGEITIERLIAAGYRDLRALRKAEPERLAEVGGIGMVTARQIAKELRDLGKEIDEVLAIGQVAIIDEADGDGDGDGEGLRGLSFCFTGVLKSMPRKRAHDLIRLQGGAVRTDVSANLSYLITNNPDAKTAKIRKARELGVEIITEERFLHLIGQNE